MRHAKALLLLAGPLGACVGKATGDSSAATPEAVQLWAGWSHTWDLLNHRVSYAEAVLEADGSARLGLVGGDWTTGAGATDVPLYRFRQQVISAEGLQVVHGSTLLTVQSNAAAQASVEVPLPAGAPGAWVAVLRGFRINTDTTQQDPAYPADYDPALGYTSRGFGFSLGEVEIDSEQLRFDAIADVRWGPSSPEDPLDRTAMNLATAIATTEVEVAWSLVGFDGALTTASATADTAYPAGVFSDQAPFSAEQLPLGLPPGAGVAGLRGFDLALAVPDSPGRGEYLRSMGVELDVAPGRSPPVEASATLTTSSLVELSDVTVAATVDVAWVALADGDATHEAILREGEGPVGPMVLPPAP